MKKTFLLNIGDTLQDYISQIKTKRGIENNSEAIRYCISSTFAKEFPDYIQVAKARTSVDPETKAKTRAEAGVAVAEAREEAKLKREHNRGTKLCAIMDGTLTSDPYTGQPNDACRYTMYSMASPWIINEREVVESLDQLNDETPSLQWQGLMNERGEEGKAVIEAARVKIANKEQKVK